MKLVLKLTNNIFMLGVIIFTLLNAEGVFAWTYVADFEQGVVGERAIGVSGYNGVDTGLLTLFTDTMAHSGDKASSFNWKVGDTGYSTCTGFIDYPAHLMEGDEVWIRAYYYFDNNWDWTTTGIKILRAHNSHANGLNAKNLSIFSRSAGLLFMSIEPSVNDYEFQTDIPFDVGRWQSLEVYVKLDSIQGVFRIWKNGILAHENTIDRTMEEASDEADFALIMSQWNSGAPQDQIMWVDDVMITNEQPLNQDVAGNYMIGPMGAIPDTQAPTLTQTTPILTPTTDNTPNYTFNSNEPGTINYTGDCSAPTISAITGDNTITLNTLTNGIHNNCTITVIDSSNNTSNLLTITPFTIDTTITTIIADVDQNSTINTTDALLTLRNSLGLNMSGTNWQDSSTTGDTNCDETTNATDALLILRNSLGLDMNGTDWCGN